MITGRRVTLNEFIIDIQVETFPAIGNGAQHALAGLKAQYVKLIGFHVHMLTDAVETGAAGIKLYVIVASGAFHVVDLAALHDIDLVAIVGVEVIPAIQRAVAPVGGIFIQFKAAIDQQVVRVCVPGQAHIVELRPGARAAGCGGDGAELNLVQTGAAFDDG